MTEPENFLERWARRKRQVAEGRPASDAKPAKTDEPALPASGPPAAQAPEPLDLSKLPPIESIAAETDVRVFLQQGVPPELTRDALRRAWSTDPAIRDFVGLVENGWDFNDPNAMPGFGPIAPDEVARLLTQVIGAPDDAKPTASPPEAAPAPEAASESRTSAHSDASAASAPQDESQVKSDTAPSQRTTDAASQNESDA